MHMHSKDDTHVHEPYHNTDHASKDWHGVKDLDAPEENSNASSARTNALEG